jgi:hypothetical protein
MYKLFSNGSNKRNKELKLTLKHEKPLTTQVPHPIHKVVEFS